MKKFLSLLILLIVIGGAYFFARSQVHDKKPVSQNNTSYAIDLTRKPAADEIVLNEPTTIKYKITNDQGEAIKDFAVAHEKLMHVILVREDLTQFQHLHPEFDEKTGEFSFDAVFTVDGPYRMFADFTPLNNTEPFVVSSDLEVGGISQFQPHPVVPDEKKHFTVPPDYHVQYLFPKQYIYRDEPLTYSLIIEKQNQSIVLQPYLGALGHSVILKEGTLQYIHTHAGESHEISGHEGHSMGKSEQKSNKVDFTATFPDPGKYKIFTQFQHNDTVYTTEYVLEVN